MRPTPSALARLLAAAGGAALLAGCSLLTSSSSTTVPTSGAPTSTASGGATTTTAGGATTTSPGTGPAGGPVPSAFSPESFTSVSLQEWWLLGTADCLSGGGECQGIVRTENGGQSFVGIPSPPVGPSEVSQLRFADPLDGYAFDPELWMTTNGGASWTSAGLSGSVVDLEAAGGEAYALVCTSSASPCPTALLERAPIGSAAWSTVATPTPLEEASLTVESGAVVLLTQASGGRSGGGTLLSSTDGGSTWTTGASPCAAGLGGRISAAASGVGVLWAACPTGTLGEVEVSTDGGAHFHLASGEYPNVVDVAGGSGTTALVWPGSSPGTAAVTTDGGSSFSTALSLPSGFTPIWAGFADADRAYLLAASDTSSTALARLYESTSGGAPGTFREVTLAG